MDRKLVGTLLRLLREGDLGRRPRLTRDVVSARTATTAPPDGGPINPQTIANR